MISVITPTFNTDPQVLARTWASLKAQTFTDWEWIVWDDSTRTETWAQLYGFAADERYRLKVYRSHIHSGIIGETKRNGFMIAQGDILVELDHDDVLTPNALAEIDNAFRDESIGFVFSDWCEILPDGMSGKYPDGWAFGYGRDYWCDEEQVWALSVPTIDEVTLQHIVSVPNHVRAWRASVYRELGGHDATLQIADDYDLIVRTALVTKWKHIPKMLYKQFLSPSSAQRVHNDEIQKLVSELRERYLPAISDRFAIMGKDVDERIS